MKREMVDCSGKQLFSNARRCCLVSIKEETDETRELCRTLDIEVVDRFIQRRSYPDPHTFIGRGKLEELKDAAKDVDLFVFDGELKPSQHFRLETALKRICADRIALVLEIFERHAQSNEAKAQVSLARIRYELPFLREWVSKGLSGDRPGFLAGGEYAIDAYYENARKQMKRIEEDLSQIATGRGIRRKRRKEKGFYLVSICGYTNGGKSTLLKSLSGAETVIDDKMFSTLSTMTRLLIGSGKKVLVTDTVGFIRNLPPDLIDAFDATMEEIYESDCAVLVLDLSDSVDSMMQKHETSLKILIPHIAKSQIIIALNKVDTISEEDLQRKVNLLEDLLFGTTYYVISARNRTGVEELIRGILKKIGMSLLAELRIHHGPEGQDLYRWMAERFVILNASWGEDIIMELHITEEEAKTIERKIGSSKIATLRMIPEST